MSVIEFFVAQAILGDGLVAGVTSYGGRDLADVGDGGVRGGSVEPDSLDAFHIVLTELVSLGAVDDLLHVGVLHSKYHVCVWRRHLSSSSRLVSGSGLGWIVVCKR